MDAHLLASAVCNPSSVKIIIFLPAAADRDRGAPGFITKKTPPAVRRTAGGDLRYMVLFVEKLISVAIAAPAAILTRSGFVHGQTAAVDFDAVELRDCGFAFGFRGHLDETESARTPRIAVHHDLGRLDGAGL